MYKRFIKLIGISALCVLLPLISQADCVTVTTKAQLLAQLPLTPGKEIIVSNQIITNWGAVTITGDCTQAQPCTIRAESPQGVIFSGQGAGEFCLQGAWFTLAGFRWTGQTSFGSYSSNTGCGGSGTLFTYDGAQNVTVDDFEITNMSGGGEPLAWMELSGGRETLNTTLSNGTMGPWTQSGVGAIAIHAKADRGFPEGIDITNVILRDRTVTGGGSATNKYWLRSGNSQESVDDSKYASGDPDIVITGLQVLRDTANHDALHMKSDDIIIQDSLFEQAGRVKARQGLNWIVRRNVFKNPSASEALILFGFNHTVANNVFYTTNGAARGFTMGKGTGLFEGSDYVALNNSIIIGNSCDGFTTACFDATRNYTGNNQGDTNTFPSSNVFHNNGVRQNLGTMFLGPGGCGLFTSVSHNARDGAAAAGCMASGSNNVAAPPLWADPNAGNYTLGAASTWINAGTAVAGTTEDDQDFNQLDRTASLPRDIGAHEFNGGAPSGSTCDQIFGGATDYELCAETGTECKFNVTLGGSDCNTLCASFGKDCTAAYDNSTPACTEDNVDTCSTVRATEICVCTIADSDPPDPPDPTMAITQRGWLMSGALALDDSAEALAPENTVLSTYINGRWNLTMAMSGDVTTDTHLRDLTLAFQYCNPSCGAYEVITADCSSHPTCLIDNPARTSGAANAAALLTIESRNFNPQSQYIDGESPNGGEASEISIAANDQWEVTYAVRIGMTAATGAVLNYRVVNADGSTTGITYLETPQVTVGSGGFNRAGGAQQ